MSTQTIQTASNLASNYTIILPARLGSTRLPQKPLLDIAGLPMIVRTAKQALSIHQQVYVATDSQLIVDVCTEHNIQCILTDVHLNSGTERVAQAALKLGLTASTDIILNLQGDEPLMQAPVILQVAQSLQQSIKQNLGYKIATPAHSMQSIEEIFNPNCVKIVLNAKQQAIYFSRAPVPWQRDLFLDGKAPSIEAFIQTMQANPAAKQALLKQYYKHIGVYGFTGDQLQLFANTPASPLEGQEMLEQLRAMHHGWPMHVVLTNHIPGCAVDTLDDLETVRNLLKEQKND